MADATPNPLDHINYYVRANDFDANSILAAPTQGAPAALTVPEQTLVGRVTGGNIGALSPATVRSDFDLARQSTVGNLLTANVASGTDTLGDTTGFAAYNATLESSTTRAYRGTRSIKVSGTNAARGFVVGGTVVAGVYASGSIPISGGAVTAQCRAYTEGAATLMRLRFYWWTGDGTVAASTASTTFDVTVPVGLWNLIEATAAQPPTDATLCSVYVASVGGGTTDVYYVDALQVAEGYPCEWAMPGSPSRYSGGRRVLSRQTSHYTLVANDANSIVQADRSVGMYVTVPPNSTTGFPIGTTIDVIQVGVGAVTLNPASGVTINANPGLVLAGQWASATLIKRATDAWVAVGNLTT